MTAERDETLLPWFTFKELEFFELGYQTVTAADLERYATQYLWKRNRPHKQFERIYQIMSITPNDYFDFETIEAQVYKVVSLQEMDISELL